MISSINRLHQNNVYKYYNICLIKLTLANLAYCYKLRYFIETGLILIFKSLVYFFFFSTVYRVFWLCQAYNWWIYYFDGLDVGLYAYQVKSVGKEKSLWLAEIINCWIGWIKHTFLIFFSDFFDFTSLLKIYWWIESGVWVPLLMADMVSFLGTASSTNLRTYSHINCSYTWSYLASWLIHLIFSIQFVSSILKKWLELLNT